MRPLLILAPLIVLLPGCQKQDEALRLPFLARLEQDCLAGDRDACELSFLATHPPQTSPIPRATTPPRSQAERDAAAIQLGMERASRAMRRSYMTGPREDQDTPKP